MKLYFDADIKTVDAALDETLELLKLFPFDCEIVEVGDDKYAVQNMAEVEFLIIEKVSKADSDRQWLIRPSSATEQIISFVSEPSIPEAYRMGGMLLNKYLSS